MQKIVKITEQTSWQILGKIVTSLSTLTILSLVARQYGPTDLGILTLALTFLAFFTLVIDFGVNAYLMPDLIDQNYQVIWKKLFGFRLLLAGILIPVAIIGGLIWPTEVTTFKLLVVIGSLMAVLEPAVYVSANAIFQSRFRYDLSVIGWSVAALSTLLLVYLTSLANLTLPWIMVDYSLGWLVGCAVLLYFVKKYVKNLAPLFDLQFMLQLVKNSWPISLTLVLNVVYFRLDSFILSSVKGFAEVGIYNLAYQIFQAALVIPTFIMNAYYPLMIKSFAENKSEFFKELKMGILGMLIIGLLGVAATLILSPLVIGLITGGKGFTGSGAALNILSLGFPAFFVSSVLMWTLVTLKRYKTMALIYLIGLIFNGLANWIFIPKYSFFASAYITGISEYLILALQIVVLWKYVIRDKRYVRRETK